MTHPTHRQSFLLYISSQFARVANMRRMDREIDADNVEKALQTYVRKHGPSGSGIDQGTEFDPDLSRADNKLVFLCGYHHMNDHGVYDGWTQHVITVRPCFFSSMTVSVSGKDRNQIKGYLASVYHEWLHSEADHPALVEYTLSA